MATIIFRDKSTPFYERNKLTVFLRYATIYDEFLLTYKVRFLMTVAKLWEEGYSVAGIAQHLKKDEYDVSDAVTGICMARENYRMNYL